MFSGFILKGIRFLFSYVYFYPHVSSVFGVLFPVSDKTLVLIGVYVEENVMGEYCYYYYYY